MNFDTYFCGHLDEFKTVEKLIEHNPTNPVYRLLMVRTIFSSMEMMVNGIFQSVKPIIIQKLESVKATGKAVIGSGESQTEADYGALYSILATYDKKPVGIDFNEPNPAKQRLSLKDRLILVVQLLFEFRNQDVNPQNVQGWSELKDAFNIRDRIMHPHSPEDLNLSKEDYNTVLESNFWLIRCLYWGNESGVLAQL